MSLTRALPRAIPTMAHAWHGVEGGCRRQAVPSVSGKFISRALPSVIRAPASRHIHRIDPEFRSATPTRIDYGCGTEATKAPSCVARNHHSLRNSWLLRAARQVLLYLPCLAGRLVDLYKTPANSDKLAVSPAQAEVPFSAIGTTRQRNRLPNP